MTLKKLGILMAMISAFTITSARADQNQEFLFDFIQTVENQSRDKSITHSDGKYCSQMNTNEVLNAFADEISQDGSYRIYTTIAFLSVQQFVERLQANTNCYELTYPQQRGRAASFIHDRDALRKDRKLFMDAISEIAQREVKGYERLGRVFRELIPH